MQLFPCHKCFVLKDVMSELGIKFDAIKGFIRNACYIN